MVRIFQRVVGPVLAASLLWACPAAAQHSGGSGGGGCGQGHGEDGGEEGGHDSGFGNNLSVPVVFAEGMGVLGLPTSIDPGLRPRPGETTGPLPFLDPATVVIKNGVAYYPQMTSSTWQAGWVDGARDGESVMVSWGDNLLSRTWSARSRIRVEVALYQEGAPALPAYTMASLFGTKSEEVWGTDGSSFPSTYRSVFAVTPRLIIEKITGPGGTVVPGVARFEGSIADSFESEGPERFAAEINGSGRVIYGYNWRLPQWTCPLEQKVGWWRLTLTLDPVARYTIADDEEGGTAQSFTVARNLRLSGLDPLDLASEKKYRPVVVNPYTTVLEIQLSASGGGGGSGGSGGGGGGHDGEDTPTDPDDVDADGLPNAWETEFGLDPAVDTATADPDGDGLTNEQEYVAGSHPQAIWARYFAEGAATPLLATRFTAVNTSATATATVLFRFLTATGGVVRHVTTVAPRGRASIDTAGIAGVAGGVFGTIVEASTVLAVERTTVWDASGFGTHASSGTAQPATTWYLPEGATLPGFELFYLLANPGSTEARVQIRYLRPAPLPEVVRTYDLPAYARRDIWVNQEVPEVGLSDVGAVITASVPIVAERSLYRDAAGLSMAAGSSSTGSAVTAPTWYLAEGATGQWFDTYLLVLNPGTSEAPIDVTYMRPDGTPLVRSHVAPPASRMTISVADDTGWRQDASFGMVVQSRLDVPVVVERAMWWPGSASSGWQEGHSSVAVTAPALRWSIAGPGEKEPSDGYLLLLNPSIRQAEARVTLTPDGGAAMTVTVPLAPTSRQTLALDEGTFPGLGGRSYSVLVESLGTAPVPIVVEFSTYTAGGSAQWGAGTSRAATPMP